MKIYKVLHAEGFEWLQPIRSEDYDRLDFDATRRGEGWRPIPMMRSRVSSEGQHRAPCDFPACSGMSSLMLSQHAKDSLGTLLSECGEILPLEAHEGKFWVLNVTRTLDVLDEQRSKLVRGSDTGRILMILRHAFRADQVINDPPLIFKLPQFVRGGTYASERLAEALDKHKLSGLRLDLLSAPN